jgi:hypothetical protein
VREYFYLRHLKEERCRILYQIRSKVFYGGRMMHSIRYSCEESFSVHHLKEERHGACIEKINAREYFFVSHLKEDGWATSGWLIKDKYCS